MKSIQKAYDEGIAWGEAKEMLFNSINDELEPIRFKFEELKKDNDYINDLLSDGAKKARDIAKDKIFQIKRPIIFKNKTYYISLASFEILLNSSSLPNGQIDLQTGFLITSKPKKSTTKLSYPKLVPLSQIIIL